MPDINGRDLANVALHRLTLLWLRIRVWLQYRLGLTTFYQPDPFKTVPPASDVRNSQDRYEAFESLLPDGEPLSTLDVGCNDGFFVFKMAERGGTCLGFDLDRNAIMVAESRAWLHEVDNALFSVRSIDRRNARSLPDVDVVICLSVFHHWVRHLGREEATETLRTIAAHAKRYLVFETGQPNEIGARWADELAFMGDDHRRWVSELVQGFGFEEVHALGDFDTTVSSTPRTLFIASRHASD